MVFFVHSSDRPDLLVLNECGLIGIEIICCYPSDIALLLGARDPVFDGVFMTKVD